MRWSSRPPGFAEPVLQRSMMQLGGDAGGCGGSSRPALFPTLMFPPAAGDGPTAHRQTVLPSYSAPPQLEIGCDLAILPGWLCLRVLLLAGQQPPPGWLAGRGQTGTLASGSGAAGFSGGWSGRMSGGELRRPGRLGRQAPGCRAARGSSAVGLRPAMNNGCGLQAGGGRREAGRGLRAEPGVCWAPCRRRRRGASEACGGPQLKGGLPQVSC